jgi:hypothetical protein
LSLVPLPSSLVSLHSSSVLVSHFSFLPRNWNTKLYRTASWEHGHSSYWLNSQFNFHFIREMGGYNKSIGAAACYGSYLDSNPVDKSKNLPKISIVCCTV